MPRQISANGLTTIAQAKGLEPVIICAINWNGIIHYYSDKRLPQLNLLGKILDIGNIESVLDITGRSTSQSFSITLDDTDSSIKNIFNVVDVHKRPVTLYQWFTATSMDDKFVLFEGLINSPIVWKEGDRTVSFDVVSKLEDNEIGFSPDDGDILNVPQELVHQAWPMPFGVAVNIPPVRIDTIPSGATKVAVGILDSSLEEQELIIDCEAGRQLAIASCLSRVGAKLQFEGDLGGAGREVYDKGTQFQQRAEDIRRQVANKLAKDAAQIRVYINKQQVFDPRIIPVINGDRFLQDRFVSIRIGDATYRGKFHGNQFHVSQRFWPAQTTANAPPGGPGTFDEDPEPITIEDPDNDFLEDALFGEDDADDYITPTEQDQREDPCGPHNLILPACSSTDIAIYGAGAATPETQGFFFAQAGTSVNVGSDYPIRYIVSIVPGTVVLGVAAKRRFGGIKQLLAVPRNLYTVDTMNLGSVVATMVRLKAPLSTIENQEWEDDIFVTVSSPIGDNIADIIAYLITTYSPTMSIDAASFAVAHGYLEPYSANFCFTDKMKLVDAIKDLAFQGMCSLWINNNIVYIKFLPVQESPVETLTISDVEQKTAEVYSTDTESLVTKFIATWKQDYAQDEPNKLILKANIAKYGIQEEEFEFYCYNNEQNVKTVATFWLIRKSNSYKKIRLKTHLHKLKIDTLDTVNLDFGINWIASSAVPGIVESCKFDSNEQTIALDIWTPVRTGEMTIYQQSLPISYTATYPNPEDEIAGNSGSVGPSSEAAGDLSGPNGPQVNIVRTTKAKGSPIPADPDPVTNGSSSVVTTVAKVAPPGITTATNNDAQNVNTAQKPREGYKYRKYKEIERPKLQFDGGSIPAVVVSKVGVDPNINTRQDYLMDAYINGLDKDPLRVTATQLQIHQDEEIPAESWFLITRQVTVVPKSGDVPDVKVKYLMQAPVWLAEDVP